MNESFLDLPPELSGVTPDDEKLPRQMASSLKTLLELQETFNDPKASEDEREEATQLFHSIIEQLQTEGFIKPSE